MAKIIVIAALWGLAVWTWVSMAQWFLGTPDLGALAGTVTSALILARRLMVRRTGVEGPSSLRSFARPIS